MRKLFTMSATSSISHNQQRQNLETSMIISGLMNNSSITEVDDRTTTDLPWNIYVNGVNGSNFNDTVPFCKRILTEEISERSVRIWDLAILIPNALFFLFLLRKLSRIYVKLKSTSSPVFAAFYCMVYTTTVVNILRCIVSMCLTATDSDGTVPDKILWLILEFFLVSAELSILSFGLLFGHLDSKTSIRRVLYATASVGIVYTALQSIFEFVSADKNYKTESNRIVLFSHGGIYFWIATSALLCLIYFVVYILPLTPLRKKLILPVKRRFYFYCAFLSLLNCLKVIGTCLIATDEPLGMCIVCLTTYIQYAFYTPIVYLAFLRGYVTNSQTALLFSYKPQKDDAVSELPAPAHYPGFPGFTSAVSFDEFLYHPDALYDSTDLNSPGTSGSPNPLYYRSVDEQGSPPNQQQPFSGGVLSINDFAGENEDEEEEGIGFDTSREKSNMA